MCSLASSSAKTWQRSLVSSPWKWSVVVSEPSSPHRNDYVPQNHFFFGAFNIYLSLIVQWIGKVPHVEMYNEWEEAVPIFATQEIAVLPVMIFPSMFLDFLDHVCETVTCQWLPDLSAVGVLHSSPKLYAFTLRTEWQEKEKSWLTGPVPAVRFWRAPRDASWV